MFTVVFLALAVVGAGGHLLVKKQPWTQANLVEALLLYFLFCSVGLGGVFSWSGHFFVADRVAAYIGWPAGNLFQMEVAFTNLALGVLGILSYKFRDTGFRLATGVAVSVFLFGAGYTHLYDLQRTGNVNPGNVGVILPMNFIRPLVFWALFTLSLRARAGANAKIDKG